ncbi:hypothetical protein [Haloarcula vallismortis]|nr:hypothetical protein [Haloarcula vallismortis]
MAAVLLLGIGTIVLANTGFIITDYQDGLLFAGAGGVGGLISLVAGLRILGTFSEDTNRSVD